MTHKRPHTFAYKSTLHSGADIQRDTHKDTERDQYTGHAKDGISAGDWPWSNVALPVEKRHHRQSTAQHSTGLTGTISELALNPFIAWGQGKQRHRAQLPQDTEQ